MRGPARRARGQLREAAPPARTGRASQRSRRGGRAPARAQRTDRVPEIALGLTEVVGLGEALTRSEQAGRRSRSLRLARRGCSRRGRQASSEESGGREIGRQPRPAAYASRDRPSDPRRSDRTTLGDRPLGDPASAVTVLPEPVAPTISVWAARRRPLRTGWRASAPPRSTPRARARQRRNQPPPPPRSRRTSLDRSERVAQLTVAGG